MSSPLTPWLLAPCWHPQANLCDTLESHHQTFYHLHILKAIRPIWSEACCREEGMKSHCLIPTLFISGWRVPKSFRIKFIENLWIEIIIIMPHAFKNSGSMTGHLKYVTYRVAKWGVHKVGMAYNPFNTVKWYSIFIHVWLIFLGF